MLRFGSRMRVGIGALLLAAAAACGGDDAAPEASSTTTTSAPIETYRQQYLVLLTANECNAAETIAVQDEIATDGRVDASDFPAIEARLQPAWGERADAIAAFQDGLANGDWSEKLNPLIDDFLAHLEEIRTVYRAGSIVESFEEFGTLIFPATGTTEADLNEALGLPSPTELEGTEWCNGVPAI